MPESVFEIDVEPITWVPPHSWLWDVLHADLWLYDVKVNTDITLFLRNWRRSDVFLMSKILKHQSLIPTELRRINFVRMYKHVQMLADIATSNGQQLQPTFNTLSREMGPSSNAYKWPLYPCIPTVADLNLWDRIIALCETFCHDLEMLKPTYHLGNWNHESKQHLRYFYVQDSVFERSGTNWNKWSSRIP